jgi:hypothetical protein
VSREAKRAWLGVGGLLVFGGSWFAIFRFSLPYSFLLAGPIVFLVCSLGSEWIVPLASDERVERNSEVIQESQSLEQMGFWRFCLQGILYLIALLLITFGVLWLDGKISSHWLDVRTAIVLGPPLIILLISIPLSYWYDRWRLRKARDKIEREHISNSSTPS